MRSADPEMPRLLQNRMKMSPLLSTVPVTATSKPSRYRSIHAQRSPAQRPESVYAPSTPSMPSPVMDPSAPNFKFETTALSP